MLVKGKVDEIMLHLNASNPIHIHVTEGKQTAVNLLKADKKVSNISISDNDITIGFLGTIDDEAELLKQLVTNNVGVTSFIRQSGNLEEIFMKVTEKREVLLMKIRINPVYGKEIKLKVRSVKFAIIIFLFNLMLGIIAITGFEVMFNMHLNPYVDYSGAAKVFYILISMEIIAVMFLVPAFTAGSIAGEREKQTLDILLTTVLTPEKIVMGKLLSSISMVLLLVVSSLPIISIVFTIGGVGMEDLVQFMLAILVISFFIGSMGMLASTVLKKTVPAMVCSMVEVMLVCVGTVIIIGVTYIIAKLYYYNYMGAVGNMPDVSGACLVLLVNPVFTVIQMTMEQCESVSAISKLAGILNGSVPAFIEDNWFKISMVSQVVITIILLKMSAFFLKPIKNIHRQ